MEDVLVTAIVDTNPGTISLSRDISNIKKIELVYFRMVNHVTPTGYVEPMLFLKIDQGNNIPTNQTVPSNNPPSLTTTFKRITSDTVLLHTDADSGYVYNNTLIDNNVTWGYQEKDMRWSAHNLHDFNGFRATLLDLNMNPIVLQKAGAPFPALGGAYFVLVFKVKFETPQYLSPNWKTDKVFNGFMSS